MKDVKHMKFWPRVLLIIVVIGLAQRFHSAVISRTIPKLAGQDCYGGSEKYVALPLDVYLNMKDKENKQDSDRLKTMVKESDLPETEKDNLLKSISKALPIVKVKEEDKEQEQVTKVKVVTEQPKFEEYVVERKEVEKPREVIEQSKEVEKSTPTEKITDPKANITVILPKSKNVSKEKIERKLEQEDIDPDEFFASDIGKQVLEEIQNK